VPGSLFEQDGEAIYNSTPIIDPRGDIVARYRAALDALANGATPDVASVRSLFGSEFTRGHFARAV